MPTTSVNGMELYFDSFGDPRQRTVLLVSGLGAQCVAYDDEFCEGIVEHGYRVVRFDNRDVGLSTHFNDVAADPLTALAAMGAGGTVDAPYTLDDLALDAVGLLDSIDVGTAHLVGSSMGGMIAQTVAIRFPERVSTLTSIMSTTGEPDVGLPDPECLGSLLSIMAPAQTRAERIENAVTLARVIGTPDAFDEVRARERAARFVDRAYDPAGTARQLVAVFASGSRAEGLSSLDVPTVVLHGDRDPLVHISGGHRTAELVRGSQFRLLESMGHDLPPRYWPLITAGIVDNASAFTD
jgi:pimeloyl-ACP methyl ester carboxylesterase